MPSPYRCGDIRFLDAMESLYAHAEIDLKGYTQLFSSKGALLSGDITPGYSLLQDEIIERIVGWFPDLKVIFLARDPVERAWSHLSMWVRHKTIAPFDLTDVDEVTRNLLRPEVLVRSHPSKIVARWRRYVCPELFRVYFFDDLKRNPVEYLTLSGRMMVSQCFQIGLSTSFSSRHFCEVSSMT